MSQGTIVPATDVQMQALEKLIALSQDAGEFTKQLLIWLLRQTNGLTESCSVLVPASCILDPELTDTAWWQAHNGIHDMNSSGRATRLDLLFELIGSGMTISRESNEGTGCRVWCSFHLYGRHDLVRPIAFDFDAIQAIDLKPLR